ncbi:NAD(P)-binding protein [Ganoderma leucocontextum]|nr:NAD(P)-binding protein [Ganoderma leucocontextum]
MASPDEFRKRTLARLDTIRSHLQTAPRTYRLKNKVCIITGVGSLKGIGRATALLFAHEGARHLYLTDYHPTNLPDLKSTIEKAYPDVKVTVQQADAADEDAVACLCKQALHEEGRLDVFFANAGIGPFTLIEDLGPKQFMETMRVNSLSCFLAVKYASAAMKEFNASRGKEHSGGSIILTASVAGLRSGAGSTDYSASKSAVNSIAQTAIYQLQKTDIRVNTICPGLIDTGMTVGVFEPARSRGMEGKIGQLNPLGRYGLPQEIANVALFLASDESSYVNGQAWAVDGGLSSSHPVIPGRFH